MSSNYSFSRDIKEVLAMSEALSEYVRGNRLYGYTSMFSNMPSLTAGALLMRLRRLEALQDELKDHQKKSLDKAFDYYDAVRTEWTHHLEEKLLQEANSRIDAMKGFFYECAEAMNRCAGIYKPEILRRTIVQDILREMEDLNLSDSELTAKINVTDERLRRYVEAAEFQWSEMLQAAYPADEFWWLYHAPPDLP